MKYYVIALIAVFGLQEEMKLGTGGTVGLAVVLFAVAYGMDKATSWAYDQGAAAADRALGTDEEAEASPAEEEEKGA